MPRESRLRAVTTQLVLNLVYGSSPDSGDEYRRTVRWDEEGSAIARETLASGKPCMIARFGSTELACVSFYTRWRSSRKLKMPYVTGLRRLVWVNSGIFPTDDVSLDRFSELYLNSVSKADVMGVWFNRNEHRIVHEFCPDVRPVQLEALNPVLRENPWSAELAGKTVLVIHPFARTIESQYAERRHLLFDNPRILPEFELKTLRAVQTIAGNDAGYVTWFDALERMRSQVQRIDFDVAIIGAGAYGLPLAAAVKDMGRQAVHLGGATQLLFGIRGRRWEVESPDDIAPLFNEYWVRPSAEETPEASELVEGGCYW
jgi:hypothetical protein